MSRHRVGQGYDAHRFRAGRRLVLCGVELDGEVGLDGHSDADVGLHAVTDAILGAVAGGDIGELFPPSDPTWRGAESAVFLRRALEIAAEAGFAPVNCDLTLVGERPRVAPHRAAMRTRLAELLGLDPSAVSVKATTTERLGWEGRREGLAATAVVLLEADP